MGRPAGRTLANYCTSTDYKLLAKLARQCSVICIVDYEKIDDIVIRDVACTTHGQHRDEEVFQISARGISYIYAFSEDEFIKLCQHRNVEFLVPVTSEMKGGEV